MVVKLIVCTYERTNNFRKRLMMMENMAIKGLNLIYTSLSLKVYAQGRTHKNSPNPKLDSPTSSAYMRNIIKLHSLWSVILGLSLDYMAGTLYIHALCTYIVHTYTTLNLANIILFLFK